jgi:hypothetical protein
MELARRTFHSSRGWASPLPVDLDGPQTLVLAFGASGLGAAPLAELAAAFPASVVLGCSTAGEIHGAEIFDDSLSVAVARFARTGLRLATAEIREASGSREAGRQLAAALGAPDLRSVLVLSDGLHVNGTELVAGLNEHLPPQVVVTGGLAGDGPRFARTWVLVNGAARDHVITAVGLYGDAITVNHGSRGGWDIFGPERLVTRSTGNILYELDGKPALQLYKTYLGDRASGLPATGLLFPLSLRSDDDRDEKRLVRTILAVDEATQSLTFAGDIPQGSRAQLMRANFERLVDGASQAAEMAKAAPEPGAPMLCVAISCVGRRLVMGERAEEEVEATLEELPSPVEQVGFYSYGELSPFGQGRCDLHNQTMTLTTLWERA